MPAQDEVIDGRYRVGGLLGRGGMADVFRATDTATDGVVALKILRGVEPGNACRLRSEVDVLARLHHPGLLGLRGAGTHEGVPYLVLDLADGPSLAGELARGPIGVECTLAVGEQVADALDHAHGAGVVHRDVKPSNILFDGAGRARLADFGIARVAGAPSLTRTGLLVGSAPYLAPEQVEGRQAGPAADVYALALVLIECVTGSACYAGGQVEAAVARLNRPPVLPAGLPGWLRDVLSAMTAREPDRRPAAAAVAEALRRRTAEPVVATTAPHRVPVDTSVTGRLAAVDDTAVLPPGAAPRPDPRGPATAGRGPWIAAVAAALFVAALLAGMVAGDNGPATDPPADPGAANTSPTTVTTASTATTAATTAAPPPAGGGAQGPGGGGQGGGHGNGRGHGNGGGGKGPG